MRNTEKLEAIISQLCKNKSHFCEKVHIANSTLSSWFTRDTMDYKEVAQAFPEISTDWLLLDQGPMLRTQQPETAQPVEPTADNNKKSVTIQLSIDTDQLENILKMLK